MTEIRNSKRVSPSGGSVSVIWVSCFEFVSDVSDCGSDFVFGLAVAVATARRLRVGPQRLAVCPGKATVEEALQTLAARAAAAVPLRATGQAMLTYHVPDKKNRRAAQSAAGTAVQSACRDLHSGQRRGEPAGGDHRAPTTEEFWLALSPKEMSSYYLGRLGAKCGTSTD